MSEGNDQLVIRNRIFEQKGFTSFKLLVDGEAMGSFHNV